MYVNLTARNDTGRLNTSPVTSMSPVVRLKWGCNHTITIPGMPVVLTIYSLLDNASVNSTCAQPPPPSGNCGAIARLVSPGGGAFVNVALPGGRAFANPRAIPKPLTRTRFPIRISLQGRFYWKKSRLAHLSWTGINCRGF